MCWTRRARRTASSLHAIEHRERVRARALAGICRRGFIGRRDDQYRILQADGRVQHVDEPQGLRPLLDVAARAAARGQRRLLQVHLPHSQSHSFRRSRLLVPVYGRSDDRTSARRRSLRRLCRSGRGARTHGQPPAPVGQLPYGGLARQITDLRKQSGRAQSNRPSVGACHAVVQPSNPSSRPDHHHAHPTGARCRQHGHPVHAEVSGHK